MFVCALKKVMGEFAIVGFYSYAQKISSHTEQIEQQRCTCMASTGSGWRLWADACSAPNLTGILAPESGGTTPSWKVQSI